MILPIYWPGVMRQPSVTWSQLWPCDLSLLIIIWLLYKCLHISILYHYCIIFLLPCGHMVTVVTVTAFICRILGHAGETLRFAGKKPMGNRERNGTFLLFAYTQTIVRLYPNECATILKLKRFSKRWTMFTRFITPLVFVTVPSIRHKFVQIIPEIWRIPQQFVTLQSKTYI